MVCIHIYALFRNVWLSVIHCLEIHFIVPLDPFLLSPIYLYLYFIGFLTFNLFAKLRPIINYLFKRNYINYFYIKPKWRVSILLLLLRSENYFYEALCDDDDDDESVRVNFRIGRYKFVTIKAIPLGRVALRVPLLENFTSISLESRRCCSEMSQNTHTHTRTL